MKVTISKTYKFEYAHRIYNQKQTKDNPETRCRNIHGHSGVVKVFISSEKLDDCGMIIDFTNLKPIKNYIDSFDHSLIISSDDKEMMKVPSVMSTCKFSVLPGNVTSETIALHMFGQILYILQSINNELILERLEFSETNDNVVIIER
jgi:6-pyruvoyltetrahydropterin/6-carboxytetrahydropterin synthase